MAKKSVRDLPVQGRRVLIRADLNVPLDDQQRITDDRRIRMFLPTLKHVVAAGGRAIVMSHLGRPKGDPATDAVFSLKPVAMRLHELLDAPVNFVNDCAGGPAQDAVARLASGHTLLLENLRFHKAETIIDKAKKNLDGRLTVEQDTARTEFAAALADLGEMYVNDAFGTCHRRHVSMYDVPTLLPAGCRAVGFLVEKELQYLGQALEAPQRPFVAVLGGAKVSDKIGVIKNLLKKVDRILVGGAMTYTFWAAQGRRIGKSLCEPEKLVLPVDSLAAAELKAGVKHQVIAGDLPDDMMGLDIGPDTLAAFREHIVAAKTIVWNGPVGAFETPPFDTGTFALARTMAAATDAGAVTVIGGGDSAAAVEKIGLADRMSHISTGGGASLEFLEGKRFESIEVLDEA